MPHFVTVLHQRSNPLQYVHSKPEKLLGFTSTKPDNSLPMAAVMGSLFPHLCFEYPGMCWIS